MIFTTGKECFERNPAAQSPLTSWEKDRQHTKIEEHNNE